ncbi:hypothetical protein LCGC14_2337300 [marine sediment metagenome]|uniref:Replication protein n=1 Tax=marine sediment metagenome TaxID=412755 RepID=A0A0F9F861_9ZZZZ
MDQRNRTIYVLERESENFERTGLFEEADELQRIANKLDDCCRSPFVAINTETSEIRIHEFRCKLRHCPYCGKLRANALCAKILPLIQKMDDVRRVDLTLKSNDDPIRKQFRYIVKCFAELRQTELWKDHYSKGFYSLEATHNTETDQWHPHIHIIVDGQYVKHARLKKLWLEITGDSTVIWLNRCETRSKAVYYVNKYVTKTQDPSVVPDHRIAEWALALKGMRFVNLFGGLRHDKVNEEDEPTKMDIHIYTPLNQLSAAITDGDEEAQYLWTEIIYHAEKGVPKLGDPSDEGPEDHRREIIERLEAWLLPPPEPAPDKPTITPEDTALFDNSPRPHQV